MERQMTEDVSLDTQISSLLVRTMALLCVRNTALESIHAGRVPVTRTGDYSDVTVIDAEGQRIPWPKVSHFDDDAMRDLMREIVDKLYTFLVRAREPGFADRIGIWMTGAGRWDQPKLLENFLPGPAYPDGAVPELFPSTAEFRVAFAAHPEPLDDMLCRIHLFVEDADGSLWSVGTDLVTQDLENAEFLAGIVNERLGLDIAASETFAERVMKANPTGQHPRGFP